MGGHMSKKSHNVGTSSSSTATATTSNAQQYSVELNSYEAALKLDSELQSFDTALQARTNQVMSSLAEGVEVRALSFESLKEVTECLLEMNQEVVKVILQCKKDIWKSQELFELVEDYFENSLRTLDFCAALEKCLKKARDSQLLLLVALREFDGDGDGEDGGSSAASRSSRTLEELRNFRAAGDPFTAEFFALFQDVYAHQVAMLDRLRTRKSRLDRRLRRVHAWRKVSSMIFVATFAAVLICSVVAAAVAAPPVAAAVAAAASVPVGSMGKWIDSLWKKYEDAMKGQREVIGSMQVGTYVAIKDLDGIRVLIRRLETEIEGLLSSAGFADEGEREGEEEEDEAAVRVGIEEIRKRLGGFMKEVEELGAQADVCSRDIRRARTVVLQRIIKNPNNH